ncbi:MAG: hypothetical protein D6707_12000, partial [Bacteroidetes bacterium]
MRKIRFCIATVVLSTALGLGACAVNTPSADDVVPAVKAAAMQFYIVAQTTRWLSLTNASTPYILSNYSVSIETNIESSNTNITPLAHISLYHNSDSNFTYNFNIDMSYTLYDQYSESATNMW